MIERERGRVFFVEGKILDVECTDAEKRMW